MLGALPTLEEIKDVVFILSPDSAPGPDGVSRKLLPTFLGNHC